MLLISGSFVSSGMGDWRWKYHSPQKNGARNSARDNVQNDGSGAWKNSGVIKPPFCTPFRLLLRSEHGES